MRCAIELNTIDEVAKFNAIVQDVDCDVRLTGKDENGSDWTMSAKSLLCSLMIEAKLQLGRESNAHNVDWNTLYVECEKDIYTKIQEFAKGGLLE